MVVRVTYRITDRESKPGDENPEGIKQRWQEIAQALDATAQKINAIENPLERLSALQAVSIAVGSDVEFNREEVDFLGAVYPAPIWASFVHEMMHTIQDADPTSGLQAYLSIGDSLASVMAEANDEEQP